MHIMMLSSAQMVGVRAPRPRARAFSDVRLLVCVADPGHAPRAFAEDPQNQLASCSRQPRVPLAAESSARARSASAPLLYACKTRQQARKVYDMAYAVDDSRWPLVVARAIAHEPVALAAGYRKLEAILERKQRFLLLFDMRGATSTSARRRSFLEWCERHANALTTLLAAAAVVAGSPIERGFVTAALWVSTPPYPMRVFANASDAEAWLLGECGHLISAPKA
jgi:hypothetical protein